MGNAVWTTANELDFLDGIGGHMPLLSPQLDRRTAPKEQVRVTRLTLEARAQGLRQYLAVAELRHDWGRINKEDALLYAREKLEETERALRGL